MLKNNPLVSVVIPVYNRAGLLIHALESVCLQTYRPLELLLVDDGSTDDTRNHFMDWAGIHTKDPGFAIHYLYQANRGANAARNLGILHSRGEFVAFIDSDDRWLSEKLEKQVPLFFNDAKIGGVYCGLGWINLDNETKVPDESRSYPEGWLLQELLVHDVTAGTPCYVIKKECFDKVGFFDIDLPARQDWDMWIRLSTEYKIASVHEILVYAGMHTGPRLSMDAKKSIEAHWRIFEKYDSLRKQFPLSVRQSAQGALYRRLGRISFHYGLSKRQALQMYLRSILAWPFSFDSYAAFAGIFLPHELRVHMHIFWNKIFGKTSLAIKSF